MIQTMEDIIRRFCAYGMEYKDHEGYTYDWGTLLSAIQLAYNTIQNFTTGENSVEVRLTEELSWKYPVFPVSLVKPYHKAGKAKLPSRNKSHTPQDIVEVEYSPGPVKKIIKSRKIRLNGKDHRQYLIRFKSQRADKDKWLAEDSITDGDLHLRGFRASRRAEKSHQ
ncbi:hypothetical protein O181_022075 [Austropuccinia psidii MF-1]|uniref:Chromo domain-containing protein n=1 Tax=Austropuccinia psidii MF-1 TaxID=1389203 RepID=A0A9Q3CFT2_9BASI|nr:hypothetical protein [Austropuccinia psidii MF-1]